MDKKPLNILVVNRMIGELIGGGEVFDLKVSLALQRAGHHVHVATSGRRLTPVHRRNHHDLVIESLTVPRFLSLENMLRRRCQRLASPLRYLNVYLFERAVMRRFFRGQSRMHFDVVYGCSMIWLPRWLMRSTSVGVVNWLPGIPSAVQRKELSECLRNSRFALFTHGDPAAFLHERLGWQRDKHFYVITPGIDLEQVAAARSQREEIRRRLLGGFSGVVGITVARLVEVKNHRLLLEGIAKALDKAGVAIKWLMVGSGPEKPLLQQLSKRLGIEEHVLWCGGVSQDEVHVYYAAADVFALTSRYESYSLATLEAMAHGLPILATRVGFLQELVQRSHSGVLVSPDSPDEFAAALGQLCGDKRLREEMGKRGEEFTRQMSWEHTARQVLQLCYAVTQSGRRGGNG